MAEEYDYLFKSIVVGDGGVGKTALTLRFSKGFFTEDYKMTIGVDFHVKTISIDTSDEPIRCKLQLWDTGGQERFSSIRPMYYRGSLGVVLVFDLTNSDSFEHLPQWIEEVRANVKLDIPLLLVGNKSDLIEQRAISIEEINRFTNDFNLYYMETSAKTGDGVGDCFYILACLMVGQGVPEKLMANSTVFAPGRITLVDQGMIPQTSSIRSNQIDFEGPPLPVQSPIELMDSPPEKISKIDLEYEAPPVPEPKIIKPSRPVTAPVSREDIDYEAPPVPEPAIAKIELPEPADIEFKMPDDILSELPQQVIPESKPSLFFDSKPVEGRKYVPKAIPFSSNIPTPAPAPEEFKDTSQTSSITEPIVKFAPTQEIEPKSDSLVDYMPDIILSKKEKKRMLKEQKKIEKQKTKLEKEEKQKQDKELEDKKKSKKEKKEKEKYVSEIIPKGTSQTTSTTNSLFQALTGRTEEKGELPKKFTPFVGTQEKTEVKSSKLRIIPNIADIEKETTNFLPTKTSKEVYQEDLKPNSKDLLICEQCGAILSADYAFCNKCGHKL